MPCCGAFKCGTFLKVKDRNCNKYYKAKIVKVNEVEETLRIHYVGWGNASDEVLPVMSPRIEAWGGENCLGRGCD